MSSTCRKRSASCTSSRVALNASPKLVIGALLLTAGALSAQAADQAPAPILDAAGNPITESSHQVITDSGRSLLTDPRGHTMTDSSGHSIAFKKAWTADSSKVTADSTKVTADGGMRADK